MDEAVLDTTPVDTAPVDPTPVDTTPAEVTHPEETPAVDPNEAMWGDLKPEDVPPVDPNADPPAIPEEFSKALRVSEYVKEPAHLELAVRAAQEIWDVQTGKAPATALLEGLRQSNPQQYEKTVFEQIIPYIEQITGKKFGAAEENVDPVAKLQAEIEQMKQRPLIEAQEREQQQYVAKAEAAGGAKIEELIKGGNGIFDGDVQGAVQAVGAQFAKMGLNPQDVMKQVLAGNMANLEKSYKAAEKAQTLQAKAYADRMMARYKKLQGSVPTPKGGSNAATSGDGAHDLTTQSGRSKAMAEAFAAGRDTI